jgi:hypothetical protein
MTKDQFGVFVVLIDLVGVAAIIGFIFCFSSKQNKFIKAYKASTVEMDDFTVQIHNLPADARYDNKDEVLKARLWGHFDSLLNGDNEQEKLEIVDITFGKKDIKDTDQLTKLYNQFKEKQIVEDRV